jgi:hypothetical protein
MEAGLTFTLTGIAAFVITTGVSIWTHKLVVNEVGRLSRELVDIRLVNEQILQTNAYQLENRRKAEMVAELFALWIQSAGGVPGPGRESVRALNPNDFKRLNELSFACALWLPQNIVADIYNTLSNTQGAKNIKEILVDVRNVLDINAGAINPMSIIHF